jgi:hypothetical protein
MRCSTTCRICEFEARKLSILEDHLDIRHMKKKTLWGWKVRKLNITVINVKRNSRIFLSRDLVFEAYSVVGARFQRTSKGSNIYEA